MSLVLNVEILGEFKKLTQATTGAEKQLGKLNKATESFGKSMRNTLAAIGVGFSLNAVVRGIGDTLEAASDLEQQFGALDSIFKELAPTLKDFAFGLAPIGLSAADASRSMALLGSQLKGYGLPVDEAAKKTQELTLLAADLAATFGGTTYGAVESISALFRGEYDPIEKYGVAIKKSDVNARLAAEGLSGLEGEALKLAEAQAALTLLFEKTTDAQGQAAREAESYAAQNAYLKAESENLKAEIGEALLPVMVELFKAIRDNLPQIKEFLSQMIELIPIVVDLAIKALEFKEAILAITLALASVKLGIALTTAAMGGMNLAFANPYFLGAAVVLGGIAAASLLVYNNTKKATSALQELERQQGLTRVTQTPSTPEQVAAEAYKGIIPEAPRSTGSTGEGIAGQIPRVPTVPTTKAPSPSSPVVINNNITVKKSTATGQDIAKAVNRTIKSAGTQIIRAL
jgi:hypothetical protein